MHLDTFYNKKKYVLGTLKTVDKFTFYFAGFLLSVLDNVQLHLHFDDATYWVMHEPSKLELTVQNKSVDEDSSKQHDNLGFDISIIDGNTITDECPNRQVDTV